MSLTLDNRENIDAFYAMTKKKRCKFFCIFMSLLYLVFVHSIVLYNIKNKN